MVILIFCEGLAIFSPSFSIAHKSAQIITTDTKIKDKNKTQAIKIFLKNTFQLNFLHQTD